MKNKLIIVCFVSVVTLIGCSSNDENNPDQTAGKTGASEVCLNHIIYTKFYDWSLERGYFGLTSKIDPKSMEYQQCTLNNIIPTIYTNGNSKLVDGKEGFKEVCLNGIIHYKFYDWSLKRGYFGLAKKINSQSMSFQRCHSNIIKYN